MNKKRTKSHTELRSGGMKTARPISDTWKRKKNVKKNFRYDANFQFKTENPS